MLQGIKWSIDQAMIVDLGSMDTQEGDTVNWAKLAFFGGMVTLVLDNEDMRKVAAWKDKPCSVGGNLQYEIKKKEGREAIKFKINEIKEYKGA